MANNTLLASDNFASGSLAAGWDVWPGNLKGQVVSNLVEANTVGTGAGQIWTGLAFPNDQISEVTIAALASGSTFVLGARITNNGYAYQVNISSTAATLYVTNSGGTAPLAVGSGVTAFAAGDVWALCCGGAAITVYQNGKRVARAGDATVPSGSPGFLEVAYTNINHIQISSWRGYSAVQQDGIWQKQGIVLPAIAGDLSSSGVGVFPPSAVLYEGGSQCGLGAGNVFKMWFSNVNSSTANVLYAESLDGKSWTRYGSAVIAGYVSAYVFKSGSTYYLYAQTKAGEGTAAFEVFTSANGVSWTDQGSTGIGLGAGGAWDSIGIWLFQPIDIIAGVWYALYGGVSNITTYACGVGLATSADGLTWTKYAGNPVIASTPTGGGIMSSSAFAKVGNTYYVWFCAGQQGRGGTAPYLDPTECIRYQSTNLINWSNPVHSIHNSEMFETLNAQDGQAYLTGILDVNGSTYAWYNASPGDSSAPQVYQVGLAIAPATIANIVQGAENADSLVASDAFTNGPGSLSAKWTTPSWASALKIVAGPLVEPTVLNTVCVGLYTGASFSNDQYSKATLQTLTPVYNIQFILLLRSSATVHTAYEAVILSPIGTISSSNVYIQSNVAGTYKQIGPFIPCTPQAGDVWKFEVIGNVLSLYQNEFLLLQVEDVNNTIASGAPGFWLYNSTALADSQISSWSGGNANVMPFGVISGSAGIAGATISYSGTTSGSVTADGSGNYTLPSLANGMYTITPSKSGVAFNPSSSTQTISNGNITGINFVAVSSNNALVTTNNLLLTNGLLVTNALLAPNLLGGTADWS
jgi:hypothetical protein